MQEERTERCATQSRADADRQLHEARRGTCARQVGPYGRGNVGQIREARPGGCVRNGRAHARGEAGQIDEGSRGRCERQDRPEA
jgi:hypothetical protein